MTDPLNELIGLITVAPFSGLFIALVSILVVLISTYVTSKMVDLDQMKMDMDETKVWREKLKQARRTADPVLLQEIIDNQQRILLIQSRMTSARMKPTCLLLVPLIALFTLFGALYGSTPVIVLPFNVSKLLPFAEGWLGTTVGVRGGFGLYYFSWYVLVSMTIGSLVRRWLGTPFM
ncbi:MAG: EMC3/TMCO1 family protein [Candidatus Thorarchaeota archaeon]